MPTCSTFTLDDGKVDARIEPGTSFSLNDPLVDIGLGTHPFHCAIYPEMTGTVFVV